MIWQDYRKILLALTIYREARGEGDEGMRAVGHCINNRAFVWKKDLIAVMTDKNQFSSMTFPGDSQLVVWPQAGDRKFDIALDCASKIIDGLDKDNIGGALYYANLKTATSGWFFDNIVNKPEVHPMTVTVGHHTFFK